jgi:hypothetical protein
MEFVYDGKHGAYQPHIVRAPTVPPPPIAAAMGPSALAHDSPPTSARPPPASSRQALSTALKSSHAATHRGKKQNILIKGLKTLISMCHSNDTLIHESHE